jgi:hypothetical protein
MTDTMSKKWKQIIYNERQGQQLLFGYDFPDMTLMKGYDIKTDLQNASIGSNAIDNSKNTQYSKEILKELRDIKELMIKSKHE